jgi:hypothetical protein
MIHLMQVIRWVQGHRAAKNTKGAFAMLDAMSEENNNIYGKGHLLVCLLGYGFGMAFSLSIIQEYYEEY